MAKPKTLEIELNLGSSLSKEQIELLKRELRENFPGINIKHKESPPLPGRMGGEIIFSELLVEAILHEDFHKDVNSFVTDFLSYAGKLFNKITRKQESTSTETGNIKSLGFSGSYRNDGTRKDYSVQGEGQVKELFYEPFSIDPEKTFVVLVGCSKFKNNIPAVTPALNNLTDLYELLTDEGRFRIGTDNIHVLQNSDCHTIQDTLYTVSRTKGIETFIFYYAGHGFTTLRDYALAAYDTEKKGDFINGGIDKKFIEDQVLQSSPAKQKILIVDACYSGFLAQGGVPKVFNNITGTYILASSSSDEESLFDKDARNTFFTEALLDVLQNGVSPEKETITLDDLFVYTTERLSLKRLPLPIIKTQLNIPSSEFSICKNPAFSYENEVSMVKMLLRQAKLPEAFYKLKVLRNKYPDKKELTELALEVSDQKGLIDLITQGESYLSAGDFNRAIDTFRLALKLNNSPLIQDKLNRAIQSAGTKSTRWDSQGPVPPPGSGRTVSENEHSNNTVGKTTEGENNLRPWVKKLVTIAVGILTIFIVKLIMNLFSSGEKELPQPKQDVPVQTDSTRKEPNIPAKDTPKITDHNTVKNNDPRPANKTTTDGLMTENPGTINIELLNGTTFEDPGTPDFLAFTILPKNRLRFSGRVAGSLVTGVLKPSASGNLEAIEGDVTGSLVFSEETRKLAGSFFIKASQLPHQVNLVQKEP